MQRHQSTLYTLPEDADDDDQHTHPSSSGPGPAWITSPVVRPTRPRANKSSGITSRFGKQPFNNSVSFAESSLSASQRYPDIYSQFVKRYRSSTLDNDPRDDPDNHYIQRGLGDAGDSGDEEDMPGLSLSSGLVDERAARSLEHDGGEAATPGDVERLEWQAMLASVLSGDVLKSEKRRIAVALESNAEQHHEQHINMWYSIRAKLHGRTVAEEKRKLEERRARFVGPTIAEINAFTVDTTQGGMVSALKQVSGALRRLDLVYSLYPNLKAFYEENPLATEDIFEARCDALNTWVTVLTTLQRHTALLRRWTGSDALDVSQPYTSNEVPISHNPLGTRKQDGTEVADGTSFVERLLKEEDMQRTFEKGSLTTAHTYIAMARDAQVNLAAHFKAMNLPTFENELVPLIAFPTKLAQASLAIRLGYVEKLTASSESILLEQYTEDLKLSIGLACTLKRQYEDFLQPDVAGNWNLPACISEDYDATILDALEKLFGLIEMRLKDTSKALYLKQTDYLEAHWPTFNDVSMCTVAGSGIVAERLCGLVNRMMHRITKYFGTQLQVPASKGKSPEGSSTQIMSAEQTIAWYAKILESVRLRFRKLQRFSRTLSEKFNNASEYSLSDVPLDTFISHLVATDHFLVYTKTYEEEGIYVIASRALRDRPSLLRRILTNAFHVEGADIDDGDDESDGTSYDGADEMVDYLLIISPCSQFMWNGMVLIQDTPKVELGMEDDRIRLVADGPGRRLALAKQTLEACWYLVDEDGAPFGAGLPHLQCLTPARPHLPGVNHGLLRIVKTTNRFANAIVHAVDVVRGALVGMPGYQNVLGDWYQFASEHGQHTIKHMEGPSLLRFNTLLIQLAISWVSFICDDCDPSDRRTFRWAVNALEFTLHRTRRNNILQFPGDQFEMLRSKVASCMTLLISHFDILGARSNLEATREKVEAATAKRTSDVADAAARQRKAGGGEMDPEDALLAEWDQLDGVSTDGRRYYTDACAAAFFERVSQSLQALDQEKAERDSLGRVLDVEKPEDRSLVSLATASLNFSVRWKQGRFVGAGAFGSVYQAVNLNTGSLMAVKEIKFQELSGLPNLISQIKDELSVMELLHHPNIVEYYGIEVHRDKVYIFEEYCQGGSLAALLEHGRIESEGIIQVYTMQMLEGLAYLHARGVAHRDIKPDNILLDRHGFIKFADFGASKLLAKNHRSMYRSRRTDHTPALLQGPSSAAAGGPFDAMAGLANNSLTGTPMYMSPEVIKNDKKGRHGAMDIWSLGCVVLEFATGKKPWSNLDNEWAIMFHIGVATQHPPLPEPGQLSDLGIDFIKNCLTLDPSTRPTANELMDHPWMLDFREALLSYEESEETAPPPYATAHSNSADPGADLAEGETTAARMLHAEEVMESKEKEVEPEMTPLSTPSASTVGSSQPGSSPAIGFEDLQLHDLPGGVNE